MLINYVPGDECRVAVVSDGKLEEYDAERFDSMNRVGNIYIGRVANVEPGIQAAFVDFGVEENGFLHVSDLHPMYFPGEDDDTTERVGKKTPRRDRPPIQACLKRGQEIVVQVLKDGVGTKGPALTGYLSIPGRFLVMMPNMDRVGVSRKVEDDDQRRKMRQVLDQLDLPDGFGFILRTAGFERTKAELKRDLAYLQRLWKDMERKRVGGNKTRLLYSESDLLVRTLRDQLTTDIDEVVIDSDVALDRAAQFMRIVAPRARAKVMKYNGPTPLFHAFDVEHQISAMHAREVDLKSGGRLVFDETEALIAIDVNSGRTRGTRDPETTAYKTNLEATDEICRQLRLRDQGGLVICDLIDMRDAKHRKEIENRFRERLKKDRARATILPISGFGILEMTRQRMKGSYESVHFAECHTCEGRGLVQKPESVAADALRELAAIMGHDRVDRVEVVVSPRVAGALLSTKRKLIGRIERFTGKHVDVRVSEAIPTDRVGFYAYEENGNDIDIDKLPPTKKPTSLLEPYTGKAGDTDWAADVPVEVEVFEEEAELDIFPVVSLDDESDSESDGKKKKRRRRRRRRGKKPVDGAETTEDQSESSSEPESPEEPAEIGESSESDAENDSDDQPKKRRRRRRGGRRGRRSTTADSDTQDDSASVESVEAPEPDAAPAAPVDAEPDEESAPEDTTEPTAKKKRSRRRRRKPSTDESATTDEAPTADPAAAEPVAEQSDDAKPVAKKKTKRSRKKTSKKTAAADSISVNPEPAKVSKKKTTRKKAEPKPVVETRPRTLYSGARRKLSASEKSRIKHDH